MLKVEHKSGGVLDNNSQNRDFLRSSGSENSVDSEGAEQDASNKAARDFTQLIPDLSLPTSGGCLLYTSPSPRD